MTDPDAYLFVHVPKTAGTSFRAAVEQTFPDQVAYDYSLKAPETSPIVRSLVYERKDLAGLKEALAAQQIVMLGGHIDYKRYAPIFSAARVITFLREPIARVVAEHAHVRRDNRFQGTLLEFGAISRNRNLQSTMLDGVALDDAAFVGITERYTESLNLLEKCVGWVLPELQLNVNPKRTVLGGIYLLTPEEEDQLMEWNALDIELYANALRLFEARLRS